MILDENFDGRNELFKSIEDRDVLRVKGLLLRKVNQEIVKKFYGVEPLFLAVDCDIEGENIEIIKLLVNLGIDPKEKVYSTLHDAEKRKGSSLLHQFVVTYSDNKRNNLSVPSIDILHLLIDLKLDINCINHIEMTPLDTAIAYGEVEISEILKENGGKKNST
jgi:ankyrin repeat protein